MLLEFAENVVDGAFERLDVSEEVVVQCRALEVTPQPFDEVELWTVAGQPNQEDMVRVLFEQGQDLPSAVVAGVVDYEHDPSFRMGFEQLPEKLVKLLGILLRVDHVMRLACPIVERTVDAESLINTSRRDHRPISAHRPDLGQGRVEVNLTLIEVEQVKGGVWPRGAFFRKSRKAFFSSYSCGSRRWVMPCLGRR